MQHGVGFVASKTLLSAIELDRRRLAGNEPGDVAEVAAAREIRELKRRSGVGGASPPELEYQFCCGGHSTPTELVLLEAGAGSTISAALMVEGMETPITWPLVL